MIQLKNPRKLWSTSSVLQKRQHENVQRGEQQASTKVFSPRQKERFREKNSRKLFLRGLDDTRQKRGPDAKKDQLVVESDERTVISTNGEKRHKNPLKKSSWSDKVMANQNLDREVSLDRNLERKDQKEDFGLRMDFVDCKCKFGSITSCDDEISK